MIDKKKLLEDIFALNEWFKDSTKEYQKVFKLIEDEFGKDILDRLREGDSIFRSSRTDKNRNYTYYFWLNGRKKTFKTKFYRFKEFAYSLGQLSKRGYMEWRLRNCYLKSKVCHELGGEDQIFSAVVGIR